MLDSILDPRDHHDRRMRLRPFGMATALRSIPGLARQFGDVPPDYVELDGERRATIACPCGERPKLGVGESAECRCARLFLNLAPYIMVANSPRPS